MDTKQLIDALEKLFTTEGERVVFWNGPDKEFLGFMNQQMFSPIEDVEVLRLDKASSLEVKLHIERDDPPKKYLVYSPSEEPEYEDDWLLDVRLYSCLFHADRASILLDELGPRSQHLRTHIAARRKFFDNKERVAKLKTLVTPDDNDRDLDRKMLAVVTRTEQATSSISFAHCSTLSPRNGNSILGSHPPCGNRSRSSISINRSGKW